MENQLPTQDLDAARRKSDDGFGIQEWLASLIAQSQIMNEESYLSLHHASVEGRQLDKIISSLRHQLVR
jgi:hypothetical protein